MFDHNTPAPLRSGLRGHTVATARALGWDTLTNGALLAAADAAGFEAFITTDQSIRYQQNLTHRRIAVVVLTRNQWPLIRPHTARVVAAVNAATPGSYTEVEIPT